MKKIVIGVISVLAVVAITIMLMRGLGTKTNPEKENVNVPPIEKTETEPKGEAQQDEYGVIASQKEITVEEGAEASFDVTFNNPDESSIREYITCKDQDDIVLVKYSALENKKIAVTVEGLKSGDTEVVVCDFEYPERKEVVKVKVVPASVSSETPITQEMAYEGVNNYCHSKFDWSKAEDNPEIMYVKMGEESETEYQVIFRSYTGALTNFYVEKTTGKTRMVESVPELGVEEEAGTFNLHDYLN